MARPADVRFSLFCGVEVGFFLSYNIHPNESSPQIPVYTCVPVSVWLTIHLLSMFGKRLWARFLCGVHSRNQGGFWLI